MAGPEETADRGRGLIPPFMFYNLGLSESGLPLTYCMTLRQAEPSEHLLVVVSSCSCMATGVQVHWLHCHA
jgi:hypothetical protein